MTELNLYIFAEEIFNQAELKSKNVFQLFIILYILEKLCSEKREEIMSEALHYAQALKDNKHDSYGGVKFTVGSKGSTKTFEPFEKRDVLIDEISKRQQELKEAQEELREVEDYLLKIGKGSKTSNGTIIKILK